MDKLDLNKLLADFDRESKERRENMDRQYAADRELRAKESERMDKIMDKAVGILDRMVTILDRMTK